MLRRGRRLVAIEVKSSRRRHALPGLEAFADLFRPARTLIVGADGVPLEEFLAQPANHWTSP